jgi:hypothetical protein
MLQIVRRNRWVIALLLVLLGQAGVLNASAVSTCPRIHDAAAEHVSSASATPVVEQGPAVPATVSDDHSHLPAAEAPSAHPSAAGCGATALPVAEAAGLRPPAAARPFPPMDAALPPLPIEAFFRPPQSS